jgi:hypothetical protein
MQTPQSHPTTTTEHEHQPNQNQPKERTQNTTTPTHQNTPATTTKKQSLPAFNAGGVGVKKRRKKCDERQSRAKGFSRSYTMWKNFSVSDLLKQPKTETEKAGIARFSKIII